MTGPSLATGEWLNPPPAHLVIDSDILRARTEAGSDFWCETHYGFVRDSGHFLGFAAPGPCTAEVRVTGSFSALYDQAGLMVRSGPRQWIKTGIEMTDGLPHLSAVVTDQRSDWSVLPLPSLPDMFWIRMTLERDAARIQYSLDGERWPMLRLAPFRTTLDTRIGPMLCSPERAGLEVTFDRFRLGPPLGKDLHDLS
ncbi:MAG: DUF1349 domain-containing protein [Geminicoccaceae bacterium]